MHSDQLETLYSKAVAAGLSRVAIECSKQTIFRNAYRSQSTYYHLIYDGTPVQEVAFHTSLEGHEKESLTFERAGPSAGDVCPAVTAWETHTGREKALDWPSDDGKVYVLNCWAMWCGPCQISMNYTNEMVARHPEWSGKAEVVALSIDKKREESSHWVSDKGWSCVSSYWLGPGARESTSASLFRIKEVPLVMLVQNGIVRWRGHPAERDLEADIASLIASDSLADESARQGLYSGEELDTQLATVQRLRVEAQEGNPGLEWIYFQYTLKTRKDEQGYSESSLCSASGTFTARFKPAIEGVAEALRRLFPRSFVTIKYRDPLPEIHRGEKCALCNKVLTEADVQYLCPHCEPKHYHCQACEDAPRDGHGSAKLAHPHKLFKITPMSDHLDELRHGVNLPRDPLFTVDTNSRLHRANNCDNSPEGCTGAIEGARYKCAHCPDLDFCEACESLFWDRATETMKRAVKGVGHAEYHVLIKIPFPLK